MSSLNKSSTSVSQSIPITSNNIYNFRGTNNFQHFYSKSVFVNNIEFQIELYLNGKNEDEEGYVQFQVQLLTKLSSFNIKSLVLFICLHCKEAHTSFKDPQILNKHNDIIKWPLYQLPISELSGDTVFGYNIELLQMKYKNNSMLPYKNKNGKQQLFGYRRLATTSRVRFEWNINEIIMKLFQQARCGKSYSSIDINNIWCLCCYPNGNDQTSKGYLVLSLKLIRLPPNIRSIVANLKFETKAQNVFPHQEKYKFSYEESEHLWWSTLLTTQSLYDMNQLSFSVSIEIIKVYADTKKEKEIKREEWIDYGIDTEYLPSMSGAVDDGTPIIDDIKQVYFFSSLGLFLF